MKITGIILVTMILVANIGIVDGKGTLLYWQCPFKL